MHDLKVRTLVLGALQTNCYVISNEETKEAIVIDPAANADRIIQYLQVNDLVCKGILLTHGHFDHIMAAAELTAFTGVKLYAYEAEARVLADPDLNLSAALSKEYHLIPDILWKDHEKISIIGFSCEVIHTPGHTCGGVCYYFAEQGILISGDTLFHESVGRTDFPTSDGHLLLESIRTKLMVLPEETVVYPGHGEATTIGHERDHNWFLLGS